MISGVPKLRASDGAAGAGLLWARAAREDRPTCGGGWAAACLEHALEQMEAHALTVALPLPLRRQADRPSPDQCMACIINIFLTSFVIKMY